MPDVPPLASHRKDAHPGAPFASHLKDAHPEAPFASHLKDAHPEAPLPTCKVAILDGMGCATSLRSSIGITSGVTIGSFVGIMLEPLHDA